ncbi:MAG: hypothetical protein ACE5LU_07660 [Anaerolineae bacterium]
MKAGVEDVERFYALVEGVPPAGQYAFDMRMVDFVKPYGAIALVTAAREVSLSLALTIDDLPISAPDKDTRRTTDGERKAEGKTGFPLLGDVTVTITIPSVGCEIDDVARFAHAGIP